jgi:hypothetical protein
LPWGWQGFLLNALSKHIHDQPTPADARDGLVEDQAEVFHVGEAQRLTERRREGRLAQRLVHGPAEADEIGRLVSETRGGREPLEDGRLDGRVARRGLYLYAETPDEKDLVRVADARRGGAGRREGNQQEGSETR